LKEEHPDVENVKKEETEIKIETQEQTEERNNNNNNSITSNSVEGTGDGEEVKKWLSGIGMERYFDNFMKSGIKTIATVQSLTPQDLEKMEINLLGHKKTLLIAIQNIV